MVIEMAQNNSTPSPWRPQAIAWDMDGTLVDTERVWINQCRAMLASHDITWNPTWDEEFYGASMPTTVALLRKYGDFCSTSDVELLTELEGRVATSIAEDGLPFQPQAQELLAEIGQYLPTALVTASNLNMTQDLQNAVRPFTFDAVIAGDSVECGKPHPEPYLLAASQLKVAPTELLVVEDSAVGVRSAYAAGTHVVVVSERTEVLTTACAIAGGDNGTSDDVSTVKARISAAGKCFLRDRMVVMSTLSGHCAQSLTSLWD